MLPHYVDFLKNHILTSSFDQGQLQELIKSTHIHALSVADHLFHFGDKSVCFYLLISGQVKLYRTSIEGHEKVVEIIQPGDSFAEAVMFMDKNKYPVNAQALKPSEVIAINMHQYRQLLSKNQQSCFNLMADLSMRIHRRLNEIDTLTLQNATFRVIHFLLSQMPINTTESFIVELSASKRLIASQLAIQPETFSRILNKLKQQNIIQVTGREILINDKHQLLNYQQ